MEQPLFPASSNNILASLFFLHPGKGQEALLSSSATEGEGFELDLWDSLVIAGVVRSTDRVRGTRRAVKIFLKTDLTRDKGEMRSPYKVLSLLGFHCKNLPT